MKREDLFRLLGQIRKFPVMQILVLTAASQFTVQRSGKIVRATKDGALLLTPSGAIFVETLKRGKRWFPIWRGERLLTDEELTTNEGEIVAAIDAMK